MMKRIIYFLLTVLVSALYSCSGQYDNIDQYATDETVYVGRFYEDPYMRVGYKRLEIDLLSDTTGRAFADDIYMGKAKKTIVEYEEEDGLRRLVYDSVCSWVNIKGLTSPKTYIFTIYAEDEYGNKSISVEALGKPYTDADFDGIAFPEPNVIPSPTTVSFDWENEVSEGLSSPLFKFIELIYSYVNGEGNTVSGKLTAKDAPSFNIKNLNIAENTTVIINCRIIPVAEAGLILDTLSMIKEFVTKTRTEEEYLAARTLRPIESALIIPGDENNAKITFGAKTDHLMWTEIRYKNNDGDSTVIHVENSETVKDCPNFERRGTVQIRCSYNPPETDIVVISEWTDYGPFILKRDPKLENWVVIPRTGWHNWGGDGSGSQNIWSGGHPMLILDDDTESGWHSVVNPAAPFPQVLIIDMKETRRVSSVIGNQGGYMNTVQIYLTDDLSINPYYTHEIDWTGGDREGKYNSWVAPYMSVIPAIAPASWGAVLGQANVPGIGSFSFNLPEVMEGRFLIILFPNNDTWTPDYPATYICLNTLEVYSD
jgi:hypothetical protein